MNRATLKLAADIAKQLLRDYEDYLESCDEDNRNGYRAHYCEHGANLWVDYDNICGPCEDGISMSNGVDRRRVALSMAKARMDSVVRMTIDFLKWQDSFPNPHVFRYVTGIDVSEMHKRLGLAAQMMYDTGRVDGFGYHSDILTDKVEVDMVRAEVAR